MKTLVHILEQAFSGTNKVSTATDMVYREPNTSSCQDEQQHYEIYFWSKSYHGFSDDSDVELAYHWLSHYKKVIPSNTVHLPYMKQVDCPNRIYRISNVKNICWEVLCKYRPCGIGYDCNEKICCFFCWNNHGGSIIKVLCQIS